LVRAKAFESQESVKGSEPVTGGITLDSLTVSNQETVIRSVNERHVWSVNRSQRQFNSKGLAITGSACQRNVAVQDLAPRDLSFPAFTDTRRLLELSANFYGKAAPREAVTAKSVSHTCQVIVQSIHLLLLHWGG
jgi:hypothetical protein